VSGARDDARRAAEGWLARHSLCEHDTGLLKFCPTCAESLAIVIDGVADARGRGSSVAGDSTVPPTEYDRLRIECSTLIDRLHVGLGVLDEMRDDEPDDPRWLEGLRAFRIALLRAAYDHCGDPEAEEILSREGHDVG